MKLPISALILIALCYFTSIKSAAADSCDSFFENENSQFETIPGTSLHLNKYSIAEKNKIISFIRITRLRQGLDPEFTSDFRSLYAEFDFPDKYYGPHRGEFYSLQNVQGEIVGTLGFTKTGAGVCELKKFYLDPSLRGRGIGKLLLQKMFERAKQMKFQIMVLQTNPVMIDAIALYEKLGFTRILRKSDGTAAVYYTRSLQ